MPVRDIASATGTQKGKRGGGKVVVTFRDEKGRRVDAQVLGQGSVSGLKLKILDGQHRIVDNVAAATGSKQTSVYEERY